MSEFFEFDIIPSDDPDVREADQGFLTEVSWTVTAPEGGKSHGVRRVLVPSAADAVVQLGLLSQPEPVAPYTGGYALAPDLAAEVATRAAADTALDGRVDALEVAPPAHTHPLSDVTDAGTAAAADVGDFATAAQGILADSATQPADLATVATTGAYADLTGKPTLGTAAATDATDYATAAQGATADGAAQKSANLSDLASTATARTNLGLTDAAVVGALPIPDPGSFYPTDTITAALQLIGGREVYGTGSPEGVVTAAVGTYYTDTTLGSGALRWAKMSGAGNTGWAPSETMVTHPNGTDVLVRRWDIGQARWQRIYYDSGLRQIPYTSGTANWTSGDLYLRRQNDVVMLWMRLVKMNAIGSKIYDLPTAFAPGNYAEPIGAIFRESQTTGNPYWFAVGGTEVCNRGAALVGTFAATHSFSGAWTYQTNPGAGVPATLPGILVTAAPSA